MSVNVGVEPCHPWKELEADWNTSGLNTSGLMNASATSPSFQRHINTVAITTVTSVMLFGALGNGLVFFVVRRKANQSPFNFLLCVLAMVDFVACVTQLPIDLITLIDSSYPSSLATCQVTGILGAHTVASSAIILSCVAYFRFSVVCNPHSHAFDVSAAKKVCIAALLSPLVIVWSSVFIFDLRILVVDDGYYYSDCGINKSMVHTVYPYIFYGIFLVICVISLIIMTICYIRVARALKQRRKVGSVSYLKPERIHIILIKIAPIVPPEVDPRAPVRPGGQTDRTKRALGLMLGVIVLFLISSVPHFLVTAMSYTTVESKYALVFGSTAYSVLLRSFYINNFLNPFLYGFYHHEFISEMKLTCKKWLCF